jgi:outer membrane receptor protein involved in Fe transport
MANPTYAARDERRHHQVARIAASLDRQLASGTSLSSLVFVSPKFLQRSERGTFRDFTRYHVGGNVVVRAERSFGRGLAGTLLAGADEALQDGAILFYSLTPQGQRGDTLRSDKKEGANNAGAFLQVELDVANRLAVVAGARYDAIRYDYRDYLDPRLDATRTFSRLTPKLGVRWRPSASRAFYASLRGGVEAPAANEVDPPGTFGQDTVTAINPLLEPIRSTSLELGTKHVVTGGRWLSGVAYDVALYTTAVTNEVVPYRGGRFYFTAGRVRRSGLEVGLSLRGPAGLSLEHALTLSRNRYVKYAVDSVHYGRPGAAADYAGNAAVGVPGAVYAVAVAYTRSSGTPVTARLSVQGTSGYYVDDANAVRVPAYAVVSLTVGLDQPVRIGRELGLRGFVTVANLLDRRYIGSAYLNPDVVGGVPVAFEPGLPRQLIVSLAVRRSAP